MDKKEQLMEFFKELLPLYKEGTIVKYDNDYFLMRSSLEELIKKEPNLWDNTYLYTPKDSAATALFRKGWGIPAETGELRVSQDQEKLISELSKFGFESENRGRSCFASRRATYFKTALPKERKNVVETSYFRDEILITEIEIFPCKDLAEAFDSAKAEIKRLKDLESGDLILRSTKDGKIAVLKYTEGKEDPYHSEWTKIWSVRTACTADHRKGLGHTYLGVFLKKGTTGTVHITIPDSVKGMFIGKGGSNIKSLQSEYGLKIILH